MQDKKISGTENQGNMQESKVDALALKIKAARLSQKRTQLEIASHLDITQAVISRVEAGNLHAVSNENLKKICDFLGVSFDDTKNGSSILFCFVPACLQNFAYVGHDNLVHFFPKPVQKIYPDQKKCIYCGGPLSDRCASCGQVFSQGVGFCPNCDRPTIETPPEVLNHDNPAEYVKKFQQQRADFLRDSQFNLLGNPIEFRQENKI